VPLLAPLLLAGAVTVAPEERALPAAGVITAFGLGSYVGLLLSQSEHAPRACRVCRSDALDEDARALRWEKPRRADALSNAGLVVTPLWSLGSLAIAGAADHRATAVDQLLVVEATMTAMLVNQLVKLEVARERPDVHHGLVPKGASAEDNLSFFSGHTTWTFAFATAAGTVASLRGYRGAPAVWAGGLTLAATTGYLRIAADRHWFTDVLTGAVVGSAAGLLMPRLHLMPTAPMSKTQAAMPALMSLGGVF
jgi:membrane-associated phospholipid phosphatase